MKNPFRARLMAVVVLATCAWPVTAQTMRAHFLDVGQGSAAIIETECAAVLIDTGGELNNEFDSTQSLIDQIEDFFFGRPDLARTFQLFVLTHPHIDHTRGVNAVLEKYKVLNAVTNGQEASSCKPGQKALHRAVAASEQSAGTAIGFEPIRVADLPASGLSLQLGDRRGVLPYTVLVDATGTIKATREGSFADRAALDAWLEQSLAD